MMTMLMIMIVVLLSLKMSLKMTMILQSATSCNFPLDSPFTFPRCFHMCCFCVFCISVHFSHGYRFIKTPHFLSSQCETCQNIQFTSRRATLWGVSLQHINVLIILIAFSNTFPIESSRLQDLPFFYRRDRNTIVFLPVRAIHKPSCDPFWRIFPPKKACEF